MAQLKAGQCYHNSTRSEAEATNSWLQSHHLSEMVFLALVWCKISWSSFNCSVSVSKGERRQPEKQKSPTRRIKHWVLLNLPATSPPAILLSKDLPEEHSWLTQDYERLDSSGLQVFEPTACYSLGTSNSYHLKARLTTWRSLMNLLMRNHSGTGKTVKISWSDSSYYEAVKPYQSAFIISLKHNKQERKKYPFWPNQYPITTWARVKKPPLKACMNISKHHNFISRTF